MASLKPCPKNKIRNPKTGRCVKKTGKIGKTILESTVGKDCKSKKEIIKTEIKNPSPRKLSKLTTKGMEYYLACMAHHPEETPLFWPYIFEAKNKKEALKMAKKKLRSDIKGSEDSLVVYKFEMVVKNK